MRERRVRFTFVCANNHEYLQESRYDYQLDPSAPASVSLHARISCPECGKPGAIKELDLVMRETACSTP